MISINDQWLVRFVRMKAFLGGGIVLLIGSLLIGWAYISAVESSALVRQRLIMDALKKQTKLGKVLPESISGLGFSYTEKEVKYYADAWDDPHKFLLLSPGVGSYIVAFGDGTNAVLLYYDTQNSEYRGQYLPRNISLAYPILIVISLLLLFLLIILIIERLVGRVGYAHAG